MTMKYLHRLAGRAGALVLGCTLLAMPQAVHASPGGLLTLPGKTIADSAFGPVDRPGPALSPPRRSLDRSMQCTSGIGSSRTPAVLFVHGTAVSPKDYSWNWLPALSRLGRQYCTVTLPGFGTGDVTINGQYVVNAIRETYARSGHRKIQIMGHSQGGMLPRFALRFWPDTRPMVDDVVSFAPVNHGTTVVGPTFCAIPCGAASRQLDSQSKFMQALNSRQETFEGISYTQIYTHLDELVQPNLDDSGTSSLRTGPGRISNVALQDICPSTATEHILAGTSDPIAYALALDALDNAGPAKPARISRSVCSQRFMPAVDPGQFATRVAEVNLGILRQVAKTPTVPSEPRLARYMLN